MKTVKEKLDENLNYLTLGASDALQVLDRVGELLKDWQPVEKPVVPKFVADYIEHYKNNETLYYAMNFISRLDKDFSGNSKMIEWWNQNNDELFAKAWLYGYEVEKPKDKKYLVKLRVLGESYKYYYYNAKGEFSSNRHAFAYTKRELAEIADGAFFKISQQTVFTENENLYWDWDDELKTFVRQNELIELVEVEE